MFYSCCEPVTYLEIFHLKWGTTEFSFVWVLMRSPTVLISEGNYFQLNTINACPRWKIYLYLFVRFFTPSSSKCSHLIIISDLMCCAALTRSPAESNPPGGVLIIHPRTGTRKHHRAGDWYFCLKKEVKYSILYQWCVLTGSSTQLSSPFFFFLLSSANLTSRISDWLTSE